MGSRAFLILMPPIVAVFVGVVVVWGMSRSRALVFDKDRYPGLVALRRVTVTSRYVGVAAGLAAFVVVAFVGPLGRGLFLAPSIAGAVLILAVVIGQQMAYGSARASGVAGVERRLIRHYLPRGLSIAVLLLLALLVASATWTTLAASPDSLGLDRAFTVKSFQAPTISTGSEVVIVESTRSPFPGSYYTSMLAIGLPIVLALGAVALWLTARRPRNGADPELVAVDDVLRKQTAEGVVAAVGLAVSITLLLVALGAALALAGMAEYGVRYSIGAAALGVASLAALVVAARCAVLLLVPGGGTVMAS
jgi:hypothetical protein